MKASRLNQLVGSNFIIAALLCGCGSFDIADGDVALGQSVEVIKYNDATNALPVCVPGGRYVCDCPNGHTGLQFCAWDGASLGVCGLCGTGTEVVADSGITCGKNQPVPYTCPSMADYCANNPCPDVDLFCVTLSCYDGSCKFITAIPSAEPQDMSPNDCHTALCDGYGNLVTVPDVTDCTGTCSSSGVCK